MLLASSNLQIVKHAPSVPVIVYLGGILVLVGTVISLFQFSPEYKRLKIDEYADLIGTSVIGIGAALAFLVLGFEFVAQGHRQSQLAAWLIVAFAAILISCGLMPILVKRRRRGAGEHSKNKHDGNLNDQIQTERPIAPSTVQRRQDGKRHPQTHPEHGNQ
jgi:multisubunit Na+/H+ antiporter MnhG subunit